MNNEPQKSALKKQAMLAALEKSLGVVSTAAKSVGIDRNLHYDWLKDDPEYSAKVSELKNVALDFAESKLHSLIDSMNPTAVIFFLKTQGKQRGYIEQNDVNVTGLDEILKKLSNIEIE